MVGRRFEGGRFPRGHQATIKRDAEPSGIAAAPTGLAAARPRRTDADVASPAAGSGFGHRREWAASCGGPPSDLSARRCVACAADRTGIEFASSHGAGLAARWTSRSRRDRSKRPRFEKHMKRSASYASRGRAAGSPHVVAGLRERPSPSSGRWLRCSTTGLHSRITRSRAVDRSADRAAARTGSSVVGRAHANPSAARCHECSLFRRTRRACVGRDGDGARRIRRARRGACLSR